MTERNKGGRGHARMIEWRGEVLTASAWSMRFGISRRHMSWLVEQHGVEGAMRRMENRPAATRGNIGRGREAGHARVDVVQGIREASRSEALLADGQVNEGLGHLHLAWRFFGDVLRRHRLI